MKNHFSPFALSGLAFALALAAPAMAAEPQPMNRVDFQTEVSQVLPNDLLRATLSVEVNDHDPAAVARGLTLAMNNALARAKAFPTVKVSSGNQRNWPIYGKTQKLESWRGRAELTVESKDFKAAGELLAQLQDSLQLQGLGFVVSEETRQDIEKQLTSEAIAAFRSKADAVRQAWGAKGYQLVQMNLGSTGGGYFPRAPMMMAMKASADEAAPVPEMAGGESRLSVSVNGTIQLQP